MNIAIFRFYASLNDFLVRARRHVPFHHAFNHDQSVKHLLESLGVPHTEVDLILVNGQSVDFSYRPADGDRISIYPRFHTIDLAGFSQVRPPDNPTKTFVLDNHLGKLASYLRMLGFDTQYQNDFQDEELVDLSNHQDRILLTRDQDLLKRRMVTHGYWVREKDPRRQLIEVLQRYDLLNATKPFTRCIRCNGLLVPVQKTAILHRLEPKTRLYYHTFSCCERCDRIYWPGSHWERMRQFIASLQMEVQ